MHTLQLTSEQAEIIFDTLQDDYLRQEDVLDSAHVSDAERDEIRTCLAKMAELVERVRPMF